MKKPHCDCLNWCGDNPQVRQGKAQPCKQWLESQQRDLDLMRVGDLLQALGHAGNTLAALEDLQRLRKATSALVALMDRMEPGVPEAQRATDDEWIALKDAASLALKGGAA